MKAYNIPTDELHINSNAGEELVSITPEKAMVKNLDVSSMGITSSAEEIDAAVAKAETIPAIESGDAGKAVVVNESENGFELATIGGSELPEIKVGDAGKVLTVNAGETGAEWATPSGGGTQETFVFELIDYNGSYGTNVTTDELSAAVQANKKINIKVGDDFVLENANVVYDYFEDTYRPADFGFFNPNVAGCIIWLNFVISSGGYGITLNTIMFAT